MSRRCPEPSPIGLRDPPSRSSASGSDRRPRRGVDRRVDRCGVFLGLRIVAVGLVDPEPDLLRRAPETSAGAARRGARRSGRADATTPDPRRGGRTPRDTSASGFQVRETPWPLEMRQVRIQHGDESSGSGYPQAAEVRHDEQRSARRVAGHRERAERLSGHDPVVTRLQHQLEPEVILATVAAKVDGPQRATGQAEGKATKRATVAAALRGRRPGPGRCARPVPATARARGAPPGRAPRHWASRSSPCERLGDQVVIGLGPSICPPSLATGRRCCNAILATAATCPTVTRVSPASAASARAASAMTVASVPGRLKARRKSAQLAMMSSGTSTL